jgi:hypothetical protein
MFRTPARSIISILAVALLVWPLSDVVGATLTDEAVREAYFLGQRNDEKTARFLETYRRRLPMPQSGLYVSEIELFTPYAETVDLSRQRTFGYTAQQAAQEYRDRGDVFRLRVRVFFTDTYSQHTYAQAATQKDGQGKKIGQYARARSGGWQGFQVQLWQKDKLIEPLEIPGIPVFRGYTNEGASYGFDVVLHYDGDDIDADDAQVVVLTPDGQRIVAEFDFAELI